MSKSYARQRKGAGRNSKRVSFAPPRPLADHEQRVPQAPVQPAERFPGTVLVDGFVAGRWRMGRSRTAATLTAELFGERGSGHDRDAITGEAGRVLTFAAPQAGAHEVRFAALRPTAAG
jgi:hypothetical protein